MGSFRKIMKREAQVAFSKDAQPIWFRILKYLLIGLMIYLFWGTITLWIVLSFLFVFGMLLHLWYRYKTEGWTKSYGLWKYDGKDEKQKP